MASVINASDSIVSFRTSEALPFSGARIEFCPVQAGSGDPSPENVRGISGWDEIDLWCTGKNMFDVSSPIEYGEYHTTYGNWTVNTNRIATDFISIKAGETYTFSVKDNNTDNLAFNNYSLFDKDKTWLGSRSANGDTVFAGSFSHTFTVNMANAAYIRLILRDATDSYTSVYGKTLENVEFQFEHNSTATSFSPYGGTNLSVTFPQTVYGGWCNPFTGTGEITWLYDDMGNYNWDSASSASSTYCRSQLFPAAYGKSDTVMPKLFADSILVQTLADFNNSIGVSGYFATINSSGRFYFMTPEISGMTGNGVKTYVTGKKFAVLLDTPIPFTFTPATLSTLVGVNNFWSNANGPINEVAYRNSSTNIETYRDRIMNSPHVEEASGSVASFQTDMVAPVKEIKVHFNPLQASGTPSPSTPIPIYGWSGLDVGTSGENMAGGLTYCGKLIARPSGIIENSIYHTYYMPAPKGTIHITKQIIGSTAGNMNNLALTDEIPVHGVSWFNSISYTNYRTRAVDNSDGHKYLVIFDNNGDGYDNVEFAIKTAGLMISMQSHSYEDYVAPMGGSKNSVLFPSEVMGGYVDLRTGELRQGWRKVKIADLEWYNYSSKLRWYAAVSRSGDQYERERNTNIYSDTLTPIQTVNLNQLDAGELMFYGEGTTYANYYNNVWTATPEVMEQADARAWIAETYPDAEICYKLATPVLVGTISPIALKTLRGQNNIWSSGNGNIEVDYWTHIPPG